MTDTTEQMEEIHKKLLTNVKKEVKQIMEEAVTRKFVHEESSSITSLCGAVEVCIQQGLRKRALGLFKNSSNTQALLSKLSRTFEPATVVSKALAEHESGKSNNRSLMQGRNQAANPVKYLWIRVALFEKQLAKIVSYLSENNSKYYEKDALMSNPVDGPIVGSLLVGPCALDYTKMKTPDHYWTDPPADELVQRHRIHCNSVKPKHLTKQDSPKRPSLHVRRNTSSSSEESMRSVPLSAKDYVESLHQNSKSTLLYGKNNVYVQAVENEKLPGYLSLHQSADGLCIKWTPNQLMNGCGTMATPNATNGNHKENGNSTDDSERSNSVLWDYAVNIFVDDIVYLHCHQNADTGGTIVLVGQDGVQRPPIHFPKGGHLLAFLSCLENGLLPNGRLDPPLWSQRGKVFPKIKRKASRNSPLPLCEDFQSQDDESTDYVFRIVSTSRPIYSTADLLETKPKLSNPTAFPFPPPPPNSRQHSDGKWWSVSSDGTLSDSEVLQKQKEQQQQQQHEEAVKQLCDTMKKQIISRAFYGWLAHCRHLKTVRTHLTGLVNPILVGSDENDCLSQENWKRLACLDGNGIPEENIHDIHKLIYYGGCDRSIRKQVWPYLLEHYSPGSSREERKERDKQMKDHYENVMSQWLAVEAIVRQRDKELMAASMAKLANPHINDSLTLIRNDSSLSNDVFESVDDAEPSTGASKQSPLVECPESEMLVDRPTSLGSPPPLLPPATQTPHSTPTSPASNGGVYSGAMLDNVALNWHRIDKDVQRCDRNYPYFSTSVNLDKLRNIMCTYVWERLEVGYVQGMCDLVAPLLVVLDDEELTYSCFCELMKRMSANFPHGIAMDQHFANMRSLIQILDSELFEHMHHNGDYTHFYFCYRWFLLDFKRELIYEDVFSVWETIWAAAHISSKHFVLFIALALVQTYRGIILDNNMDFTDIIKFFNEMAERHNAKEVLSIARDLVRKLHELIENK